jgi:hypothetical protein
MRRSTTPKSQAADNDEIRSERYAFGFPRFSLDRGLYGVNKGNIIDNMIEL